MKYNIKLKIEKFIYKDMTDIPAKNLGGRPRKELDEGTLIEMCKIQCTRDEICQIYNIDDSTLNRKIKEWGSDSDSFASFYKEHSQDGKKSLRRMQWTSAQDGSVPMQIWLGKNMLGQKDKSDQEIEAIVANNKTYDEAEIRVREKLIKDNIELREEIERLKSGK